MATTKTPSKTTKAAGFSAEERAAMKDRAQELKSASTREAGLKDLLGKVAELPEPDRSMAERIHAIVTATAPDLAPRTYYGMPAYARNGKVLCFFQPSSKFKVRYSTLGFEQEASLDDGTMWPTAFALTELTPAVEARIAELVKRAAS